MTVPTDDKPPVPLYVSDPSLRTKSPWMADLESVADFLFETLKRALVFGTVSYIRQKTDHWTIDVLTALAALMLGGWLFVKIDWWATAFVTKRFTPAWTRRQRIAALLFSSLVSAVATYAVSWAVFEMASVTAAAK